MVVTYFDFFHEDDQKTPIIPADDHASGAGPVGRLRRPGIPGIVYVGRRGHVSDSWGDHVPRIIAGKAVRFPLYRLNSCAGLEAYGTLRALGRHLAAMLRLFRWAIWILAELRPETRTER